MTYKLNVCLLSGIFEKCFGLANFAEDYAALVAQIDDSEYMKCFRSDIIDRKLYKLFCKLCHFFDDLNFYINISLSPKITQERYSKFENPTDVAKCLEFFLRRVESMKIPKQIQDTIAGFLKMQLQKFKFHNSPLQKVIRSTGIKSDEWLAPNLLKNKNLHIVAGKPKNFVEKWGRKINLYDLSANFNAASLDPDPNYFRKQRIQLLTQIAHTWEKFRELRLGQLISNSLPEGTDLFYVSDAKLIQLLKDFEENND
jgi:hypothetical protein